MGSPGVAGETLFFRQVSEGVMSGVLLSEKMIHKEMLCYIMHAAAHSWMVLSIWR